MLQQISTALMIMATAVGLSQAADVNIKDFGAVGDGVALNTAAVQRAIDHAPNRGAVSYGYRPDAL